MSRLNGETGLLHKVGRTCVWLYLMSFAFLVIMWTFFNCRHSPTPIEKMWALPFPHWMIERPWESIWYFHSYASGWVAYWVVLIKVFGLSGGELVFKWINLVGGATMAPATYIIGLAVIRNRRAALIGAVVIGLSPSIPLFASYILYDSQVAYLLTAVVAVLSWTQLRGRSAGVLLLALCLAASLVFIRAFYHIGLLLPLIGLFLWQRPRWWMVTIAAVAIAMPLTMYVKNKVLFGSFSGSTMLGFNLSKMSLFRFNEADVREHAARGELTPLTAAYPQFYDIVEGLYKYDKFGYTEVYHSPVLNDDNVSNINMVAISREYGRVSAGLIRKYPKLYLGNLPLCWWMYSVPPSRSTWFVGNPAKIELYRTVYVNVVDGEWFGYVLKEITGKRWVPSWMFLVLPPILVGFWARALWKNRLSWRRWRDSMDAEFAAYSVMAMITYTTTLGTLLEMSENNRYAGYIEPLYKVAVLYAIVGVARWVSARRSSTEVVAKPQ